MHGELIRVKAEDGLELVGFYAAPAGRAARRAVLHIHGSAGNFYENRFVSSVCEAVVAKGLAFLTLNNRGHEYISDNLVGEGPGTTFRMGGSSREVLEECLFDVGAGAQFLAERGHEGIYFEGHSLGCLKVVNYLVERRDERAVGAILLSPADMFGLRIARVDDRFDEIVEEARRLVASGKGDTPMPGASHVVPFSAATVVSRYGDPAKGDVFPFRLGQKGDYRRLASLTVPMLVTYGTVEEAVTVPVEEALALVTSHATSSPRVETLVIPGASHIYLGHELALAEAVAAFVEA
jgi:pimeloyl-ACP methyl ester carboxylesterase